MLGSPELFLPTINLNHSFCGSTESSERSQGLIFEVIETVSG